MRIYNKHILSMACFGMLAATLASCDTDKTIEYQAAPTSKAQPVFFPLQPTRSVELGDEDSEVIVNVFRADAATDATFDLTWEGDTQMFISLPTTAEFAEGDLETQVIIEVDPSTFQASKVYELTVTIPGTETTPYSQNYINFAFEYFPMSPWQPFMADASQGRDGYGIYTFANYYTGYTLAYVESRYSLLNENEVQYRFQWYIDNDNPSLGFETFITAASNDGGKTIYVPEQEFDYNAQYGMVYVMEAGNYNSQASSGGSYFDDISGTFYLDVIYFVDQGYFGYGYETCTLFGFADTTEYKITLTDGGTVVIGDNNYQLVNFSWSETVNIVAYTVVETSSITGEDGIDEELVWKAAEGMLAGTTQFTQIYEQGLQAISLPTGGNYTVIAGAFRGENDGSIELKATGTLSFTYTSLDPNDGWTSLGYVEYTDGYLCGMYLGIEPVSYYVEVQENDQYQGYMRLVNPYGAAYPYNEEGDWNPNVNSYLYVDTYDPDLVYVDLSPQTLNWEDGELVCWSYAGYLMYMEQYDQIVPEGAAGSLKNGVVTFPFQKLLCSFGNSGNFYQTNAVIDTDVYEATGELVYKKDSNGNPIAPFKIDFNTLTDDPLAAATRSVFGPNKHRLAPQPFTPALPMKKVAKHVKYKSQKMESGKRQTYRDLKPFNF